MLAQLMLMGNGLVDTLVAGRLGRLELAAGGIGAGFLFFASLSCIGLMAGISPTLSQLIGQSRRAYVGSVFTQGLWIGIVTGVLAMLFAWLMVATVGLWSIQSELVPLVVQYLMPASLSLPAFAIVMACRNACEATGFTRGVLLVQGLGLVINIVADLALGLGWFGFPKLGLFGIGVTTTIVSVSMAVALVIYLRGERFSRYRFLSTFEWPRWSDIRPMLVLSVPIYLALLFEAGLFVATALQMGMLGTVEAGAHNIAGLYTSDLELRLFATQLIALAALFQLSDGAQVALLGILRGMNDTRVPMLINAFSYWAVAFAVGYYTPPFYWHCDFVTG